MIYKKAEIHQQQQKKECKQNHSHFRSKKILHIEFEFSSKFFNQLQLLKIFPIVLVINNYIYLKCERIQLNRYFLTTTTKI